MKIGVRDGKIFGVTELTVRRISTTYMAFVKIRSNRLSYSRTFLPEGLRSVFGI
jgi:hypothetical protein